MTNAVLIERLCSLVQPPRKHLVTCHGALVSAYGLRPKVVPRQLKGGRVEGTASACRMLRAAVGRNPWRGGTTR